MEYFAQKLLLTLSTYNSITTRPIDFKQTNGTLKFGHLIIYTEIFSILLELI